MIKKLNIVFIHSSNSKWKLSEKIIFFILFIDFGGLYYLFTNNFILRFLYSKKRISYYNINNETELLSIYKNYDFTHLVSLGSPIIFKDSFLKDINYNAVNIHNGLTPTYRGHLSTFWELYNDEKTFVTSLHKMSSKVDSEVPLLCSYVNSQDKNFIKISWAKKKNAATLLQKFLNNEIEIGKSTTNIGTHYNMPNIIDLNEYFTTNKFRIFFIKKYILQILFKIFL